jgi:hypothetical protein
MILMRTLRKDYARYSKDEELDDMVCSTEIWKYVSLPYMFNFWTWVTLLYHETPVDEHLFAWIFGLLEYDLGSKFKNLLHRRLVCHSKHHKNNQASNARYWVSLDTSTKRSAELHVAGQSVNIHCFYLCQHMQ